MWPHSPPLLSFLIAPALCLAAQIFNHSMRPSQSTKAASGHIPPVYCVRTYIMVQEKRSRSIAYVLQPPGIRLCTFCIQLVLALLF